MTDLAVQPRFTPLILSGAKPFTLRRAWANGRTPDLGASLRFVEHPRSRARRVVGTALVAFRCTILFDEAGVLDASIMRRAVAFPEAALRVADLIKAAHHGRRNGGLMHDADEIARLDGFGGGWGEFWHFHNQHRAQASGACSRELIGFGAVSEEFGS